ncbi:DNA -binding domain-containing protein [Sphingopyxis granuli]|uniref:DNA -binding domain-containing protein n=1 Tax=Sphingopyxis granuli TaxID=267128 RepID=UPI00301C7A1D
MPLDRLIFPFTVAITPRQIAEFRRLVGLARGQSLAAITPPRLYRVVLALRVIDALGQGASLRTIGEVFVREGDWPGRGESTKSAARRLVGFTHRLWSGGPATILSGVLQPH